MKRFNTHWIRLRAAPLYAVLAALAIGLVWGLAIFKIAEDKRQTLSNVHNDLHNVVIGLKEHSQDSFNAADEALRMLKFHYEATGTENLDLVSSYFQHKAVDISALNQVGIIDAKGIYIYSNLPNHNRIDLSDREHFTVHKHPQAFPLFISKPVLGRASGKWSFQMTRRLNEKNGDFKGVATASLMPDHFLDRYSRIQLGPDSLIGLVGSDGYARTMRVGDNIRSDDNLRNLILPKSVGEASSGYFFSNDFFDQTRRIFVFEKLSGMPLFAIVGVREDVALQHFYQQKNIVIVTAWLLSIAIVLVAWYALHSAFVRAQLQSELDDLQAILTQMEASQTAKAQQMAALQRAGDFGKIAHDTAVQCEHMVDAIHVSLAAIEKQRNAYESLTQVYFRLKMEHIHFEEFLIIVRKLKPELILDELTGQLKQAKEQLHRLDTSLAGLTQTQV